MENIILFYRMTGWTIDVILIYICLQAISKKGYWIGNYKVYLYYLLIITILEIIASVLVLISENTQYLNYIYIVLEFILINIFLSSFINNKLFKKYLPFINILFLIFQIINAFWLEGYQNFNSIGLTISLITQSILSFWAFKFITKSSPLKNIYTLPESWIVGSIFLTNISAFLFYYLYIFSIPYYNEYIFNSILITGNIFRIIFLFFVIKGISLVRQY